MNLWDLLLKNKEQQSSKDFKDALLELTQRNRYEALPKSNLAKVDPSYGVDYSYSPLDYGLNPEGSKEMWKDHPDSGKHISLLLDQYPREYRDTRYQLLNATNPESPRWTQLLKKLESIKETKKRPKQEY